MIAIFPIHPLDKSHEKIGDFFLNHCLNTLTRLGGFLGLRGSRTVRLPGDPPEVVLTSGAV